MVAPPPDQTCRRCGACCTAPDIAALDKPLGVRCPHLDDDCLCAIYQGRPEVCRAHRPDEVCRLVAAPTLQERARRYLALFGLEDEAERVRAAGHSSMRRARAGERDPSSRGA